MSIPVFQTQYSHDLNAILIASVLISIFVIAGIAHSFWLRSRVSRFFNYPIDANCTLFGKRIFGDNKSWRGFVVIVPLVGLLFCVFGSLLPLAPENFRTGLWDLTPTQYTIIGFFSGLGFMLGELPNSFIKRQLHIQPGKLPMTSVSRLLFSVLDRIDSIVGMLIVLSLFVFIPFWSWIIILLVGPIFHLGFSLLLWKFGVKERMA